MRSKEKSVQAYSFHKYRKEQEINGCGACQSHVVTKELFCLCSETGFEF